MDITGPDGTEKKRRRTGGIQQRLNAASCEDAASTSQTSNTLAPFLLNQWAWGECSVQHAQTIAKLAKADMQGCGCAEVPETLQFLCNLGSGGAHPSNLHRDILKRYERESKLPAVFLTQVPLKGGPHPQSFMLPHELFASLFENYSATFFQNLVPGGKQQLQTFWSRFCSHPCMDGHWLVHQPSMWENTVPLNIHGDGVPTAGRGKVWVKMLLVLSWCSCLATGSTREVCHLMYAVPRPKKLAELHF